MALRFLIATIVLCPLTLLPAPASASVLTLQHAEFLLGDQDDAGEGARWEPVTLPDIWARSRPGRAGFGWYRIEFDLPAQPRTPQAVLIPRISMNGAVYLNGALILSGGPFGDPGARVWNRTQFQSIPAELFRAGRNVIHVHIQAYANLRNGGLSAVMVGDALELRPQWWRRYVVQVVGSQIVGVLVALTTLLCLLLWLRERQRIFGYLVLLGIAWLSRLVLAHTPELPFTHADATTLHLSSIIWFYLLVYALIARYVDMRRSWYEYLLGTCAIAGPLMLWVADLGGWASHITFGVILFPLIPLAAVCLFMVAQSYRMTRKAETLLLLVVSTASLGTGVHEWMVYYGLLAFDSLIYTEWTALALFAVIMWTLVNRFLLSLQDYRHLTRQLEQRVQDKQVEIEAYYRREMVLIQNSAIAEERHRLTRDVHDGIGSRLIATLALARKGRASPEILEATLTECLEELRLIIDSLDLTERDLLPLFGNLRARLEPRLRMLGIELHWHVTDLPPLTYLTPQKALQVLRIFQEAFNNVLKHSGASQVVFETIIGAAEVTVTLRDNGRGFVCAEADSRGRGLTNMRTRAGTLGACLAVDCAGGWTRVSLSLPTPANRSR